MQKQINVIERKRNLRNKVMKWWAVVFVFAIVLVTYNCPAKAAEDNKYVYEYDNYTITQLHIWLMVFGIQVIMYEYR